MVTGQVDRCALHPGVKWYGERPCFCCDPAAWADAPWIQNQAPEAQDADGVAAAVREMVESGHWPPQ